MPKSANCINNGLGKKKKEKGKRKRERRKTAVTNVLSMVKAEEKGFNNLRKRSSLKVRQQ